MPVKKYHTGLLMLDRQTNREVDLLADRMYRDSILGRCHLLQRRVAEYIYDYYAIPTPKGVEMGSYAATVVRS